VDDNINIGQLTVAQKAAKYRQWAERPNVHVGLHYGEVVDRYGLVSLMIVLGGELKHKCLRGYLTNFSSRHARYTGTGKALAEELPPMYFAKAASAPCTHAPNGSRRPS
jgi:hypothetical protein